MQNDELCNFSFEKRKSDKKQARDNVGMMETAEGEVMQVFTIMTLFQKRAREAKSVVVTPQMNMASGSVMLKEQADMDFERDSVMSDGNIQRLIILKMMKTELQQFLLPQVRMGVMVGMEISGDATIAELHPELRCLRTMVSFPKTI